MRKSELHLKFLEKALEEALEAFGEGSEFAKLLKMQIEETKDFLSKEFDKRKATSPKLIYE